MKDAIKQAVITLAVIYVLNRVSITRGLVQEALA
tara:strand:- start:1949 stop:2050 length:102 start_codon:yes stop_codon:yes gene_type:complete